MDIGIAYQLHPNATAQLRAYLLSQGLIETADSIAGVCRVSRGRIGLRMHVRLSPDGLCQLCDGWMEPGVSGYPPLALTEPSALSDAFYKLLDDAGCSYVLGLIMQRLAGQTAVHAVLE